jgi:hypothetical protein
MTDFVNPPNLTDMNVRRKELQVFCRFIGCSGMDPKICREKTENCTIIRRVFMEEKGMIPPILEQDTIRRLLQIKNLLYVMDHADLMLIEEQDERRALIAERDRLKNGE